MQRSNHEALNENPILTSQLTGQVKLARPGSLLTKAKLTEPFCPQRNAGRSHPVLHCSFDLEGRPVPVNGNDRLCTSAGQDHLSNTINGHNVSGHESDDKSGCANTM